MYRYALPPHPCSAPPSPPCRYTGGNNYQSLQAVWEVLQEYIRRWLAGQQQVCAWGGRGQVLQEYIKHCGAAGVCAGGMGGAAAGVCNNVNDCNWPPLTKTPGGAAGVWGSGAVCVWRGTGRSAGMRVEPCRGASVCVGVEEGGEETVFLLVVILENSNSR